MVTQSTGHIPTKFFLWVCVKIPAIDKLQQDQSLQMKPKVITLQKKLGLPKKSTPDSKRVQDRLSSEQNITKFSPGVELGAVIEGAGVVHGEHVARLGLCGAAIRYGHSLHFEFLFGADVRN